MTARILLADDSPHAQRIGQRILLGERFEVELCPDGAHLYPMLDDFDPDVVIVDVFLPNRSGYEICHWIKSNPRYEAMRVALTAGILEPLDEAEARAAGCDAIIRKPFEASEVLKVILPLVDAAHYARGLFAAPQGALPGPLRLTGAAKPELDPDKIQAAVQLAMEAALPAMIKEVTERVLAALGH